MKRYLALLATVVLAGFSNLTLAQEQVYKSERTTTPTRTRVGPPSVQATAAQLETQADLLRAEKSFADALDYYHTALKKANTAQLWNKIGITELQTGKIKDAGKSFEHSIKIDPNFPEAYNNRGAVYYITGAQQQAKAEQAHKSVPHGAIKNYEKAVKEYLHAMELHEDNASYHSNLGTAYFALKNFPEATNEYARALQLDPEVFEHKSQAGVAAQMSSPEDRAHYSFVLARMYAKSGNLDRALQYLRKAIEDGYKDVDSVYKDQEFTSLRKDPRFTALMSNKPTVIPQ